MGEALITAPWALLVTLVVTVALADWLGRKGIAAKLGSALIVILFGAILANIGAIPKASDGGPVYDPIFEIIIPGSIFLVLLDVNLSALKRAGGTMVATFLVGALGVCVGVIAAFYMLPMDVILGNHAAPFAGMYAATYTGGSANFNAVAFAYEIFGSGTEFVAALVVDNVMTAIWLILLLPLPAILARLDRFRQFDDESLTGQADQAESGSSRIDSLAVSVPVAMAAAAVFASGKLASWISEQGLPIPSILIVTTLALIAAQLPGVHRLRLAQPIGVWGMLLFLACIGASADLAALIEARELGLVLFGFVTVVFVVHLAFLLAWGWWRRIDPVILAMASVTNIGGSSTAFVVSEANHREDLLLPGILVGALGSAIGTYIGFGLVALLGG